MIENIIIAAVCVFSVAGAFALLTIPKHDKTNGDVIRHMSDKQIAIFIAQATPLAGRTCPPPLKDNCPCRSCFVCWMDWLKKEVEDG